MEIESLKSEAVVENMRVATQYAKVGDHTGEITENVMSTKLSHDHFRLGTGAATNNTTRHQVCYFTIKSTFGCHSQNCIV